jgi:hypothetical protein
VQRALGPLTGLTSIEEATGVAGDPQDLVFIAGDRPRTADQPN